MRKPLQTLAPQQARSKQSLSKLLKAAVEVLGQHGIAGATVPRIAAHAGLTPGAVYRRFRNKDVLLQTAILHILEDQNKALLDFSVAAATEIPFPTLADQIINSIVLSYRVNASLLRAVRQFLRDKEGTPFWRKATKLETRTFQYLVDILVTGGRDIKHPDPRAAAALGITMVMGTLWEVVVNPGDTRAWNRLLPKDDRALRIELTRAFLAYLEVERKA